MDTITFNIKDIDSLTIEEGVVTLTLRSYDLIEPEKSKDIRVNEEIQGVLSEINQFVFDCKSMKEIEKNGK